MGFEQCARIKFAKLIVEGCFGKCDRIAFARRRVTPTIDDNQGQRPSWFSHGLATPLSSSFRTLCAFLWRLMKSFATGEARGSSQIFFDAQQLIVLCGAISARQRSSFDLPGVGSHC